jgi:hypothetical protein
MWSESPLRPGWHHPISAGTAPVTALPTALRIYTGPNLNTAGLEDGDQLCMTVVGQDAWGSDGTPAGWVAGPTGQAGLLWAQNFTATWGPGVATTVTPAAGAVAQVVARLDTKGGAGAWAPDMYAVEQELAGTGSAPITLQASGAAARRQLLIGRGWYSGWAAPAPQYIGNIGGGGALQVCTSWLVPGFSSAVGPELVTRGQDDGDFLHGTRNVYGNPEFVSVNWEWS